MDKKSFQADKPQARKFRMCLKHIQLAYSRGGPGGIPQLFKEKMDGIEIQEVFHVYLNKFENAITHLFLVIFGNY